MPRWLGRLWRSGGRRAQVEEAAETAAASPTGEPEPDAERVDVGRRLEEARQRLRATIPPHEEPEGPGSPQT